MYFFFSPLFTEKQQEGDAAAADLSEASLVIISVARATRMNPVYMAAALSKPSLRLDARLSRLSRDSPLSPLFDAFLSSQQQLHLLDTSKEESEFKVEEKKESAFFSPP